MQINQELNLDYLNNMQELLTKEEQIKLEAKRNLAIGFWIGWITMYLMFASLIILT